MVFYTSPMHMLVIYSAWKTRKCASKRANLGYRPWLFALQYAMWIDAYRFLVDCVCRHRYEEDIDVSVDTVSGIRIKLCYEPYNCFQRVGVELGGVGLMFTFAQLNMFRCLLDGVKRGFAVDYRAFIFAARNGHLECFEYLKDKIAINDETIKVALANDYVRYFEYYGPERIELRTGKIDDALRAGAFKCFKYFISIFITRQNLVGFELNGLILEFSHNIEYIKMLSSFICVNCGKWKYAHEFKTFYARGENCEVVRFGSLGHARVVENPNHAYNVPAQLCYGLRCGNVGRQIADIDVCKGCSCETSVLVSVNVFRDDIIHHILEKQRTKECLESIKYLYSIGHYMNESAMDYFATDGNLDGIKFVFEQVGKFSSNAWKIAAEKGHVDCMRYMYNYGFPATRLNIIHKNCIDFVNSIF